MVLFSKGKVWHIDFRNAKLPKHSSSQVIFRYCDMHLCTIGQKHTDSISDKLYTSLSFDKFSTDAQETSNISNFTSFQRFECWYLFAIFWNSSMFRVRSDKLYTSLSCDRFFTDAQETSNISNFTSFHRFECRNLFAIFWNTIIFWWFQCAVWVDHVTAFFEISHLFFWRLFSCLLCFYNPSWHHQTLGF